MLPTAPEFIPSDFMPVFRFARRTGTDQPVEGAVFVTGCGTMHKSL